MKKERVSGAVEKAIECVAFLLVKNNKMLIEKRKMSKKVDPGKFVIPGGGIEKGETIEESLLREVKEELTVRPIQYHFLVTLPYQSSGLKFNLHYFLVTEWTGKITSNEAESVHWRPIIGSSLDLEIDRKVLRYLPKKLQNH
ncbi:MAG: NUDIX domain-containing protein [archaeon]